MKKTITILTFIILIIAICLPIAYAINNQETKSFFEVEETKVNQGNDVILYLNLDYINAEIFEVNISTNTQNGKFNIDNKDNINITTQNQNNIILNINKNELNGVNKIALYYNISQEIKIGTIIDFNANILIEDEEINENKIIDTHNILVEVLENSENKSDDETNIDKENTDNEKPDMDNKNNNEANIENNQFTKSNNNLMTERNNQTNSKTSIQTSQMSSSKTSEQSVYNGSSNNYLSSIEIEGYELTPGYLKTNDTYFLTVNNDIENIDINATVEDENASLCIYGNTNLVQGENKVLISVTAENGNVRTYRIYVTRKA